MGDLWRARRGLGGALWRLVRALHLSGAVSGSVGLDDPADTAILVGALNGLTANQRALDVAITRDWQDDAIRLRGRLSARFRLAALGWVALQALLDKGVRRAVLGRRRPTGRRPTGPKTSDTETRLAA